MAPQSIAILVTVLSALVIRTSSAYSRQFSGDETRRNTYKKKPFGHHWKSNFESLGNGGGAVDFSKWMLGISESVSTEHLRESIAHSLSGKYYALYTKVVEETKVCPKRINLHAIVSRGIIQIPLPGGLRDPLGLCGREGAVQAPYIAFNGKSHAPSPIVKVRQTAPIQTALVSKIPENLISCPGRKAHPFASITVTPLNRYLVPILIQNLKAVGISKETIRNIFDNQVSVEKYTSIWLDSTGAACRKKMRMALSHLRNDYVLSLNRKSSYIPERSPMSGTSRIRNNNLRFIADEDGPPSCVLLGGSSSKTETAENMEKFVSSMDIIFTKLPLPLPRLEKEIFFPTNANCKLYQNGPLESAIKILSKSSSKHRGPYGWSPVFAVNFSGIKCGTMQVHRFSEAFRALGATTDGLESRKLASRISNFLEEHAPVLSDIDTSHPTFTSYFPEFQTSLRKLRFKSTVFIARISFSQCAGAEQRLPIELVIVKKPVSFFYCNEFTENVAMVAKFAW